MAEYKIYDKNGNLRYTAKSVKYNASFMDIDTVTVTVKESSPIAFAIGDYLDFIVGSVITSARFILRDTPEPKKIARSGSYGGAFQYELVFKGAMWDVKNALFIDIVLNDNFHHFTSLPDVSTYENVFGIIDRVQANLNAIYPDRWMVDYDSGITPGSELYDLMNEPMDFALSNGTVLDALNQIYEQWGVPYIHFYDSTVGKDRIRFGTPFVPGKEETGLFKYGKGNGLCTIRKNVSNKDEIKTRITAYGNTTNMPARYYNNIKVAGSDGVEYPLIGLNMYVPNLMIPYSKWGKTTWHKWTINGNTRFTENRNPSSGEYVYEYPNIGSKAELWSSGTYIGTVDFPDIRKNYYDNGFAVAKFGIRPKTVYFDGSDDREDIHPSLKGITIKQVRLGVGAGNKYYPSTTVYTDENDRVDEIKSAVTVEDDGYANEVITEKTVSENAETLTESYDCSDWSIGVPLHIHIFRFSELFETWFTEDGLLSASDIDNIYFGNLSLENGRINSLEYRIWNEEYEFDDAGNPTSIKKISLIYIGECSLLTKTYPIDVASSNLPSNIAIKKGRIYISFSADCTADFASKMTITYNKAAFSFKYKLKNPVSDYFYVTLKQIGFRMNDDGYLTEEDLQIAFTDGHCGGWSFNISNVTYNSTNDDWTLKCIRKKDETLSMRFPNKSFSIRQGDKFVLLHINMPDLYIKAKEQYLYDSMLSEDFGEDKFVIEPEIDNLKMQSYSGQLRTGMKFVINDADIFGADNLEYLIDSISVDIPDADLPKYSVVLRDEKGWNPIEKLQSQNKTAAKVAAKVVQSESRTNVTNISSGGTSTGEVTDHSQLSGRDADDSHPMSAITELQDFKDLFDSMFEVGGEGEGWYIRAKRDFASVKGITAYATSPDLSMKLSDISDIPSYVSGRYLKVGSDGHTLEWAEGGGGGSSVSWGESGTDYAKLTVNGVTKSLLTSHQSLSNYYTKTETESAITGKGYITASEAAITYVKKSGDTMTGALIAKGGIYTRTVRTTDDGSNWTDYNGIVHPLYGIDLHHTDWAIQRQSAISDYFGLIFHSDPNQGKFIFDGGNVGIGKTSPAEKLDVNGAMILRNGSYYVKIEVDSSGNLKVNGNILATGGVTAYN